MGIGQDGLVHTPKGGIYAKTTEAIANFRRELKYDASWHQTRQRYICLILLIIFLTFVTTIILLIPRSVYIKDVRLHDSHHHNIWHMQKNCPNEGNVSPGCNVSIASMFAVKVDNENLVPATVN